MIFRRRDRVAEQLELVNAHLALIAEVIQKPQSGFKGDGWYLNRIEKAIRERPVPHVELNLESLNEITELVTRWVWLQLPDESKKDLMP